MQINVVQINQEVLELSKYEPIEVFLKGVKEDSVELPFSQMEELVGFKLPDSAYKHRAWWSNGKRGGSKFWLRVGWLVETVVQGVSVTFRREIQPPPPRKKTPEKVEVVPAPEILLSLDLADIPGLIKDLQLLVVEGLISEEEFEEKKDNLLGML